VSIVHAAPLYTDKVLFRIGSGDHSLAKWVRLNWTRPPQYKCEKS
jgi:hypothetical protein